VQRFGSLYGVVNNAGEQHPEQDFAKLDLSNLEVTFKTNIIAQFYFAGAALEHLRRSRGWSRSRVRSRARSSTTAYALMQSLRARFGRR
jgi:NAD(P)-dependent dehydrogenase (short-subunit alcohol dehydrogenase family)